MTFPALCSFTKKKKKKKKNPKPDDSVLCHFHYVTTRVLTVRIHPVLLSACGGPGHGGVSPSGHPFAQPCDDTRNYRGSQGCKLPVFTGSDISVGALLPDVTVCCTGQNFNKVSAPGPISETCAFKNDRTYNDFAGVSTCRH